MSTIIGNGPLPGTPDNDVIIGGSGNDQLYGQDGHDLLVGDGRSLAVAGDDLVDGGAGYDSAAYVNDFNGVTVDLRLQGQPQSTGRGNDTIVNVENLIGTPFSDVLIGDGGDNILWGFTGGSDRLIGNGGNDLLIAAPGGAIYIDGGIGIDWLGSIFPNVPGGLTINLTKQGQPQDTGQGFWTILNIENVSGSTGDDVLTGNAGNNVLAGSAGSDTLYGAAGNDTLLGDGEANFGVPIGSGPTTVYLLPTAGDPGNDTLYGGDGNDTLAGGPGNDQAFGGNGNDLLYGAPGDDLLDGGAGVDTADYFFASAGVTVDLSMSGPQDTGPSSGADTLISIANLTGSEFDDRLMGDGQANVLSGGGGGDRLFGGDGADRLFGGSGNDQLVGDRLNGIAGADHLNGGLGDDKLSGGAGSDVFEFSSVDDGFDEIFDFSGKVDYFSFLGRVHPGPGDGDKIDVSQIDANELVTGNQAFKIVQDFDGKPGELMVESSGFGYSFIYMDTDGDALVDMTIQADARTILAADFVL